MGLEGWVATKPLKASHPSEITFRENLEALPPTNDLLQRALNPPSVPLDLLFPGAGDCIRATWFSGELRVPRGRQLLYVHMGFGSVYEQDLIFTVERGRITKKEIVDRGAEVRRRVAEKLVGMFRDGAKEIAIVSSNLILAVESSRIKTEEIVDRGAESEALRAALARFTNTSSPEALSLLPDPTGTIKQLLKLADQLGFPELQSAIAAALNPERTDGLERSG
jgi:hypothetical protein